MNANASDTDVCLAPASTCREESGCDREPVFGGMGGTRSVCGCLCRAETCGGPGQRGPVAVCGCPRWGGPVAAGNCNESVLVGIMSLIPMPGV